MNVFLSCLHQLCRDLDFVGVYGHHFRDVHEDERAEPTPQRHVIVLDGAIAVPRRSHRLLDRLRPDVGRVTQTYDLRFSSQDN